MKTKPIICGFCLLMLMSQGLFGQMVTREEASVIATRFIQKITDQYGDWAGVADAYPQEIQELKSGEKTIGYYCDVVPDGFLLIPLRRELGPVKASSDRGHFDPEASQGLSWILKDMAAKQIGFIDSSFRSISQASIEEVESLCEFSYRQEWDEIFHYQPGSAGKIIPEKFNYSQGQVMLTTLWNQEAPYNNFCPDLSCPDTGNGRALVGCTAIAMGQIMRYWAWPPHLNGSDYWYQWSEMKDVVETTSPQSEQDAVATLLANVAQMALTVFGCDESTVVWMDDIINAYNNYFYYSRGSTVWRKDYEWSDWWIGIKGQLNVNRPITYLVNGHAIACDGWRESNGPEYHMNYGWGEWSTYTCWYLLDNLYMGGVYYDRMVAPVFPNTALSQAPTGTFPGGTIRYFDVDASTSSCVFQAGNWLQFGKGRIITGTGSSTGFKFSGTPAAPTLLYTDGVLNKGVTVTNGTLQLINGGQIRLYP